MQQQSSSHQEYLSSEGTPFDTQVSRLTQSWISDITARRPKTSRLVHRASGKAIDVPSELQTPALVQLRELLFSGISTKVIEGKEADIQKVYASINHYVDFSYAFIGTVLDHLYDKAQTKPIDATFSEADLGLLRYCLEFVAGIDVGYGFSINMLVMDLTSPSLLAKQRTLPADMLAAAYYVPDDACLRKVLALHSFGVMNMSVVHNINLDTANLEAPGSGVARTLNDILYNSATSPDSLTRRCKWHLKEKDRERYNAIHRFEKHQEANVTRGDDGASSMVALTKEQYQTFPFYLAGSDDFVNGRAIEVLYHYRILPLIRERSLNPDSAYESDVAAIPTMFYFPGQGARLALRDGSAFASFAMCAGMHFEGYPRELSEKYIATFGHLSYYLWRRNLQLRAAGYEVTPETLYDFAISGEMLSETEMAAPMVLRAGQIKRELARDWRRDIGERGYMIHLDAPYFEALSIDTLTFKRISQGTRMFSATFGIGEYDLTFFVDSKGQLYTADGEVFKAPGYLHNFIEYTVLFHMHQLVCTKDENQPIPFDATGLRKRTVYSVEAYARNLPAGARQSSASIDKAFAHDELAALNERNRAVLIDLFIAHFGYAYEELVDVNLHWFMGVAKKHGLLDLVTLETYVSKHEVEGHLPPIDVFVQEDLDSFLNILG